MDPRMSPEDAKELERLRSEVAALGGSPDAVLDRAQGGNGEVTSLGDTPESEVQMWAAKNNIRDVNDPRANYDYRGFFKETRGAPIRGGVDHFPDTYKRHGHPTFSRESKYSRGPGDGGVWLGDD